jgi:hypothetical protein
MNQGTNLYTLAREAEALYLYLDTALHPDAVKRDKVMNLVHAINAAYVEWGFALDTEYLRAPRQEVLDFEVSQR